MAGLDREQRRIVRLIRAEGRNIRDPKKRRIYERAAVQTGLVESGLRNLRYGDADSQGWRQERKSLYPNPTNLRASVRRFRQEFQQHYDPGEASYEVAAQVQRPAEQYRGRYRERAGEAKAILGQYGGAAMPARTGVQPGTPNVSFRNRYETIPGQSMESERRALKMGYLSERGKPGALLDLAQGLKQAKDIPAERVLVGRDRTIRYGQGGGGGAGRRRGGRRGSQVKGPLREMFYNGPGGINVDEGKRVQSGYVSGHDTHVHVAGQQRDMVRLGKLAQSMGLSVRENPAFDPVDPVHTKGSFHYGRREGKRTYRALDVSGDSKKLLAFNRRVASAYGV